MSKDTGPKSLADGEKAPVDLFKAVFQDSDDSEDSDSDSSDEEQVTGTVMFEPKTKVCRKSIQSRSNPRFNLLDIKVGRYLVGQMYVKVASYTYGFISISLDPVSLLCCLLLRRSNPPCCYSHIIWSNTTQSVTNDSCLRCNNGNVCPINR